MNYTVKIILLKIYNNENEIYQREILFNWKYSKFWKNLKPLLTPDVRNHMEVSRSPGYGKRSCMWEKGAWLRAQNSGTNRKPLTVLETGGSHSSMKGSEASHGFSPIKLTHSKKNRIQITSVQSEWFGYVVPRDIDWHFYWWSIQTP